MFRRTLVLLLAASVINLVCAGSLVADPKSKAEKPAARVKTQISKLRTGPGARIGIKLQDKTKLIGYVSEIADDHFVITDSTGSGKEVMHSEVARVDLSPTLFGLIRKDFDFKKLGLVLGVSLGTLVLICAISKRCEE